MPMTTIDRWWVKRAGEPKGPFPTAVLENNIRQGRVREDDLLSQDGANWLAGRDIPRFAALWGSLPPQDPATEVEEHATAPNVDGGQTADMPEVDRLAPEDPTLVARRERATRVWSGLRQPPRRTNWKAFAILGVLVTGVFVLSTRGTRLGADDARCSAEPAPELNLEFCNLAGRDLRARDLSRANLRNAKLAGADLSDARLEEADLAYADLAGAVLSNTNLARTRMAGARLNGAILAGSNLRGADLGYADFSQAKASNNDFEGARFLDTLLPSAQPCTDNEGRAACARLMEPRPR